MEEGPGGPYCVQNPGYCVLDGLYGSCYRGWSLQKVEGTVLEGPLKVLLTRPHCLCSGDQSSCLRAL